MTRKPKPPVETEILGVKFLTTRLPYKIAEDHLAEVLLITTRVFDRGMQEVDPAIATALVNKKPEDITPAELIKLLPALAPIAMTVFAELGNGVLTRLAPVIFSTTVAIVTDEQGNLEKRELLKESDRALLFDEHPGTYLPALFFAGRVTYGPFVPVSDLIAKAMTKITAPAAAIASTTS